MLITGFPAAAFGTNCYVVATARRRRSASWSTRASRSSTSSTTCSGEHRLQPVAVLLTHGHIDHTYSVTPVCDARDVPAYIHPDDGPMLADPLGWLSPETKALFQGRLYWTEPDDVKPLADGEVLRARRSRADGRPRPGAHPRVGGLPAAVRRRRARR